jgi:hypothetical protein
MTHYRPEALVSVHAFTRQNEGDETIIGRPEIASYLAIPTAAVEILDWLRAGKSCAEAAELFEGKHGDQVDIAEFLATLEAKGFVSPQGATVSAGAAPLGNVKPGPSPIAFHFDNLPVRWACRIFGKTALGVYLCIVLAGIYLASQRPQILPRLDAFVFRGHMSTISLGLLAFALSSSLVHELAHLVAAKAAGVSSRITFSNRLWILVAETDLSGLWSIPKSKRFMPLMAGIIIDLVGGSLIAIALYFAAGSQAIPPLAFKIGQAMLLVILLRILWQFYFYLQTDFYFVITTALGCRSLMRDTENYLRNRMHGISRRFDAVDQAGVPEREMRIVRIFSFLWVAGRGYSFAVLLFITLPTLWWYARAVVEPFRSAQSVSVYTILDRLILACVMFLPFLIGFYFWIKGFIVRRRWDNALNTLPS